MSRIVRFPAYRLYDQARIEMNDAVMAALVSLGLAKHILKTADDEQMTAELFPDIENIRRLYLSVSATRILLDKTDSHLATMAIPYILSLHEDYMITCLKILRRAGALKSRTLNETQSNTMHENFQTASRLNLSPKLLEQFHLIRLIRNSFIHNGGMPSPDLMTLSQTMSTEAINNWRKLTGKRPSELVQPNQVTQLGYGEILLALAVTKNISQEANIILQSVVPKLIWCDIFREDFVNNHTKINSEDIILRKVSTYAKHFYDSIGLSAHEQRQIASSIGW